MLSVDAANEGRRFALAQIYDEIIRKEWAEKAARGWYPSFAYVHLVHVALHWHVMSDSTSTWLVVRRMLTSSTEPAMCSMRLDRRLSRLLQKRGFLENLTTGCTPLYTTCVSVLHKIVCCRIVRSPPPSRQVRPRKVFKPWKKQSRQFRPRSWNNNNRRW